MAHVPGLGSARVKVGRLVYFGRMLDKIRLHASGKLPADYVANLGDSQPRVFDARICMFLGVPFAEVQKRTLEGGTNEEVLAWCHARGTPRSDFECELFNTFLSKRGWRDEASEGLQARVKEYGLEGRGIETFFDLQDADEQLT